MPGWPTSSLGRGAQLVGGLLVSSVGIWLTIRAGLGVASWEVLHIALAERFGIGIGTASMLVGAVLVLLVGVLGVRPGVGTVLNVLVIGVALNLLLATSLLATLPSHGLAERLVVLVAGFPVFAVGCAVYVGAHLGPGPRDGLMLALHLRLPIGVGTARVVSEGDGSRPRVVARRPRRARHGALRRRSPDLRWRWRSGGCGCDRCRAPRRSPGRRRPRRSREQR